VNDPRSIGLLQDASKANNTKTFKKFVESTWRMVCFISLCLRDIILRSSQHLEILFVLSGESMHAEGPNGVHVC
jgi:hypothetical protein